MLFEKAEWIIAETAGAVENNRYFDYKTEFLIQPRPGKKVILHIAAVSLYAVFLNEQFVDCAPYPGYEDYQAYDSLDITPYILNGANTLKIIQYVVGADFSTHRKQKPGIIFALWEDDRCILSSNKNCLSRINPNFGYGEMEFITLQLGYSFQYDATAAETAYRPSVTAGKEKMLYERPVQKLQIDPLVSGKIKTQGVFLAPIGDRSMGKRMWDAYLAPRCKEELLSFTECGEHWKLAQEDVADGAYFLVDTGEESAGYLELDFDVPNECDVLIGYGEHLEDLRVRSYVGGRNFCASYRAKAGRNTFFQPFLRLGMRYLQIHIYSKTGTVHHFGIRRASYPFKEKKVCLPDCLHQKIWDVSVRTLRLCHHEHYEDCPWREQALYAFDSRIQMLCGYYAFHGFVEQKASLRLMALSIREDGLLELCSPGKPSITIPSFTAVFIRQLWEYLEYSGDMVFVRELFQTAEKIVNGFAKRMAANNLVPVYADDCYWNFYEWRKGLDSGPHEGYDCPLNAFISDAFYCFARICEAVKPEMTMKYDYLHEQINCAIHSGFYNPQEQVYRTRMGCDEEVCHQLTQALVLHVGAVPDELISIVTDNMISEKMMPCTLSGSIYKYEALLRQGERYQSFVKEEIEQIWGGMLLSGATTFWETEAGASDFEGAGSLCHGWSAVPVYLYGKYDFLRRK